jgi:hypothetical protein
MFKRFRKKIQKVKEGMILAHTFKSGERLWTYPEDKIQFVCIAHENQTNEYKNFLMVLNQSLHESKILASKIVQNMENILSGDNVVKNATETITLVNYQLSLPRKITEIENELKEVLFCMFFVTDDEVPYTYNEFENAKKIRLLNENLEQKAKFFFALTDTARALITTFNKLEGVYFEGIQEQLKALILENTKKTTN